MLVPRYAFFPPSPPWYGLRDKAGNELRDKAGNLQMDSRWPYHYHEPGFVAAPHAMCIALLSQLTRHECRHGPSYRVLQLQTKRGQTLAAVYVTAARKASPRPCHSCTSTQALSADPSPVMAQVQTTLLFSHGNAVDIGQLVPFFQ